MENGNLFSTASAPKYTCGNGTPLQMQNIRDFVYLAGDGGESGGRYGTYSEERREDGGMIQKTSVPARVNDEPLFELAPNALVTFEADNTVERVTICIAPDGQEGRRFCYVLDDPEGELVEPTTYMTWWTHQKEHAAWLKDNNTTVWNILASLVRLPRSSPHGLVF